MPISDQPLRDTSKQLKTAVEKKKDEAGEAMVEAEKKKDEAERQYYYADKLYDKATNACHAVGFLVMHIAPPS